MNIERIALDRIDVGERLRAIDEDYACLLAASMAVHGQMTPIEVRAYAPAGRWLLVAGAHRFRALEMAGIETATCQVFTGSDLEAALREVDENLIRHELSDLDRAAFLSRRKELYEQLHPETRQGNNWSGQYGQFGHTDVGSVRDRGGNLLTMAV